MQKIENQLSPLVGRDHIAGMAGDRQETANAAPCWFVVETTEGGGTKAQLALAVAGLTIWRPFDVRRDPNRGRNGKPRRDISTPRFGRYFFIRCAMSPDLRDAIRRANGIAAILCGCGTDQPAPVPDSVIEWLRSPEAFAKPCVAMPAIGDVVRVKEGPFETQEGKVSSVDGRGVLVVDLPLFGRLTPTLLVAGHVELIRAAKSRLISPKKPNRSRAA